jgi:hypothetical protein
MEEVEMVALERTDCRLAVQLGSVGREEVRAAEGRQAVMVIDLFRVLPRAENGEEGVEAVLRAITVTEVKRKAEQEAHDDIAAQKKMKLDEEECEEDLDNDSNESNWSIHTQDLVDLFK